MNKPQTQLLRAIERAHFVAVKRELDREQILIIEQEPEMGEPLTEWVN